jgi:hypothetical protein
MELRRYWDAAPLPVVVLSGTDPLGTEPLYANAACHALTEGLPFLDCLPSDRAPLLAWLEEDGSRRLDMPISLPTRSGVQFRPGDSRHIREAVWWNHRTEFEGRKACVLQSIHLPVLVAPLVPYASKTEAEVRQRLLEVELLCDESNMAMAKVEFDGGFHAGLEDPECEDTWQAITNGSISLGIASWAWNKAMPSTTGIIRSPRRTGIVS